MTENDSRTVMQRERMRLGRVRKSFAAGVDLHAAGSNVTVEFFAICVDYIKAAMDRLHDQDQRIHDLLKPHVAARDSENLEILAHLHTRLDKSREALRQLVAARDRYRANAATGWDDFKTAIDHFMDVYFNILLKGQHSTLEMQKKLLDDKSWDKIADVTQMSRVIEATLFAQVKKYAPEGANPDSFKAGPPPAAQPA